MAKFFLYLGSFTGVITIFGTAAYFSIFKNDYQQPLVTVIQNVSQEENKEEEIIDEEKNNNFLFFDNIISIIILLLAFFLAFYFVYYSSLSLVAKNNDKFASLNKTGNFFNGRSIFRKTVLFNGKSFPEKYAYFFIQKCQSAPGLSKPKIDDNDKGEVLMLQKQSQGYRIINRAEVPFYQTEEIIIKSKIVVPLEEIKQLIDSVDIRKKMEPFIKLNVDKKNIKKYYQEDNEVKKLLPEQPEQSEPSCCEYFMHFYEGKLDFFNRYNIFAFLLSLLFFFVSFAIPYFVFHFLDSLVSVFFSLDEKEIKKNKFLLAFYRALNALIFLNLPGLLKIIPGLLFLIILSLNVVLFFGKGNEFFKNILKIGFFPIVCDVSDPNAKLEERVMNIYEYDLKNFFENGEIDIRIDELGPYLPLLKKIEEKAAA